MSSVDLVSWARCQREPEAHTHIRRLRPAASLPFPSASPNHLIAATGTVGSPLRAHRSDSALAGLFTSLAWVSSSIVEESAARWARSVACSQRGGT